MTFFCRHNANNTSDAHINIWEYLCLIAIIISSLAYHAVWILENNYPPMEHSCRNIQDGVIVWNSLKNGSTFAPTFYPPLGFVVSIIAYELFGFSMHIAQLSMLFYLIPIIAGCWWLGRYFGGRYGGIISALAISGSYWLIVSLHSYFLEVPLMAFLVIAYVLALESEEAKRPFFVYSFGICIGCGLLVKWSFLFHVFPMLIWFIWIAWKNRKNGHSAVFYTTIILICASIFTILALPHCEVGPIVPSWSIDTLAYKLPLDLLLVLSAMWLGLLLFCIWEHIHKKWSECNALAIICSGAFFCCYYWYYLESKYLYWQAFEDFSQEEYGYFALEELFAPLVVCVWFGAILTLGRFIYEKLWLRNYAFDYDNMVWLGLFFPIILHSCMSIPSVSRYVLPESIIICTMGIAWLGRLKIFNMLAIGCFTICLIINYGLSLSDIDLCYTESSDNMRFYKKNIADFFIPHFYTGKPIADALNIDDSLEFLSSLMREHGEIEVLECIQEKIDYDIISLCSLRKGATLYLNHYFHIEGINFIDHLECKYAITIVKHKSDVYKLIPMLMNSYAEIKRDVYPGIGDIVLLERICPPLEPGILCNRARNSFVFEVNRDNK